MALRTYRFSPSAWIIAGISALGALVAGCGGGGGHAMLPPSPASVTQFVAGTKTGSLAIKVPIPSTGTLTASSVKRSAQYISGATQGVYITGTCVAGGGTVTQNCTGAAFPPVYADVSASSPLCSGMPRVCTLSANPVAGYSYAITVAAVNTTPTGSSGGYGTGFATTASMLAVGSQPPPLPAATGSPAPSPTPTNPGVSINRGGVNSISIGLNAVATQFIRVDPDTGAAALDNVLVVTPNGSYQGLPLYFSAGDAGNNLIAAPSCMSTYTNEVGSGAGATIPSPTFPSTVAGPTGCDGFAGPDGKQYALSVTSSLPAHVCAVSPCSGTAPTEYQTSDFAPITAYEGVWTQSPAGVLDVSPGLVWDGTAANDSCTGTTPKCGVPIALTMNNNIPATATAIVGKTTSYNVTNAGQFYAAPFVETLSCGTNAGCSSTTTPSGCAYNCPQIGLNNGGTATVTGYVYASGGAANLASGTGCYTTTCLQVAVDGAPPANTSPCYTGLNEQTGVQTTATPNCNDVLDTGQVAGTQPAGTVDCEEPLGAPSPGTTIALIQPGTFKKGSVAPPGVADSMTFTVQAVAAPTTGYCYFQMVDPGRSPGKYSVAVYVQVSASGTVITVPPTNPLPGSFGTIPASVAFAITPNTLQGPSGGTATLTAVAKDGNGNTITGTTPYSTPIVVTDNDTSGGISLSSTTFTKPGDTITVTYNGTAATTSTTFTTASVATVTPAKLIVPPPHQSLYVVDQIGGVYIFAPGANGNATPIRAIAGSNTGLTASTGIALDASGNIYVTNGPGASIAVFAPDANGNVAPIRTIAGSNTGFSSPTLSPNGIAVDGSGNVWVTLVNESQFHGGKLEEFQTGAAGNVAPIATIGGSLSANDDANDVSFDASGDLHEANTAGTFAESLLTFSPANTGNVAPALDIAGSAAFPQAVSTILFQEAYDANGNVYVAADIPFSGAVYGWPLTTTGNVAPSFALTGSNTGLGTGIRGIAIDVSGNLYVAVINAARTASSILVFAPNSNGNYAPFRTITGSSIGVTKSDFITINP